MIVYLLMAAALLASFCYVGYVHWRLRYLERAFVKVAWELVRQGVWIEGREREREEFRRLVGQFSQPPREEMN